ncbi:hypothetical protein TB2_025122 [Malus domestica]
MEIANVRDKLGVLFEHPPSPDMHKRRGELMQELDNLLGKEETFWRQRARTQWLKEVIGIQGSSILALISTILAYYGSEGGGGSSVFSAV